MGYEKAHAIIVTGYGKHIRSAHRIAMRLFPENQVSPILTGMTNAFESFFVAPDGSKEGWEERRLGGKQ